MSVVLTALVRQAQPDSQSRGRGIIGARGEATECTPVPVRIEKLEMKQISGMLRNS